MWFPHGHLKKETEALLIVGGISQSPRTDPIKANIDRSQSDSLRHMC